ncbi:TIGR03364 family FAD-dependent oxidoreductase [Sphingomonas koreensis]|uniref:TIGR03364 family FAD-dependent oxidoreductase n=1 Tax=Sphingomonas koreensis TaxID=93064 RepID=UPI00082C649B|nr:TIGR03364 family FAD-dependent oxidoreductase [Sphingomonas koreensis]PJI90577.1 FAD dependent oxidoreductase TIGR03364 [Sphingomonas koreensis]RSU59074.1 TIGR03364 family FAD-dependent oxidoreductase [Sphingomonas koreensis]RSU67627.1 TIGR03364 family FAD-dependent oxidoreductase [Sphingomonas koreensis]
MDSNFDVAVVGRGIVGLAHALAAARAGKRVVVVDRHARATGASIRNFGFVTVTGQERHEMWPLAKRARDIWAEVAPRAGIAIEQTGMVLPVRREASVALLEAFLATEMGEGCTLVNDSGLRQLDPDTPFARCEAALISPHELRVEARAAIPALAEWMARELDVTFAPPTAVIACEQGRVVTSAGEIRAEAIFVCPGDDLNALFPQVMAEHAVTRCKLQMLRLAAPGWRMARPVMSDLGLARYEGYAALPEAEPLKAQLHAEQSAQLDAGIHLIAVQSADGSLVVGDSHDYGDAPDPFHHDRIDALMLEEFGAVLGAPPPTIERWIGVYASSPKQNWFSRTVASDVHVTVVTNGAGMSTAFAIGERVVGAALNAPIKEFA